MGYFQHLSTLWDLSGQLAGTRTDGKPGPFLWTRSTHDINDLPKIGLDAPEFLKTANKFSPRETRKGTARKTR